MFAKVLALLFFDVLISFGVIVFCRLLKENCGLNVKIAKKVRRKWNYENRIKRMALKLKRIYA
jgi:hypothetical protein